MKNMKAKALADGAVCAALSVLLMVIGIYVPALSLLMCVAAGTPMIYLGVRCGTRISALAAVVGILVLFVLSGNVLTAVLTGVMDLLPGVVIGYAVSRKSGYYTTVLAAAGAILFGLMLQLILLNAGGGGHGIENTINDILNQVKSAADPVIGSLAEQGGDQAQNFAGIWNAGFEQMRALIFLYMPSFVLGASLVLAYFTVSMGIFLLRRVRALRIPYRPFCLFCAPKSMCYAAMILFFVSSFSQDSTVLTAALKNLVALMYAYFSVCGLSLIDFKLSAKIYSGYARFLVYFAAFLVGYIMMALVVQGLSILGIIDGLFDFRHLRKAGEDRVGHE